MSRTLYLEMLEFMRPHSSVYEEAFIEKYLVPLGCHKDGFGNLILDVGDKPNILWSSHTDTVHTKSGLQRILVDKAQIARVKYPTESDCLGADCTTGVYIMVEMIKAGVEGRYVFHRQEEVGRKGSIYIATKTPNLLKGIDAAIAFDRKGLYDVITHQGSRTASDAFGESLAAILGMGYKPSPNGLYTDTKSYQALVPECVNISVGYAGMHTRAETQDLVRLDRLVEVMRNFDSSSLVIQRTPAAEPVYQQRPYYSYHNGSTIYNKEPSTIFELVRETPMSTAKLLEMIGWDFESLQDAIDLIQLRREDEIWDDAIDTDGNLLPQNLIAPPKKKRNRKHKVGIH